MMANKKEKKLTPEQVKTIVEEIDAWNDYAYGHPWSHVRWVEHLEMPGECYLIRFENDVHMVFKRNEFKKLRPVNWTTYFAPHWTSDPRFGQPSELEKEIEKQIQHEE